MQDGQMSEYGFIRHQRALTQFASAITRDREDARDVVQEVFAECLSRRIDPNPEYLFRSVRNRSLNVIRSRGRLERVLERWHDMTELLQQTVSPAEDSGIIETMLKLPSRYKEVVVLRINSGLTVAEVASILDIPEGTVKSRLNTALKMLRTRLEASNHD
jgi:RNA polymerase sigma-70 factor (ECF subfamily)